MKNQISCKNNFFPKNCKAAMEMSVGTIVTIVLLMSVLVLGIFLVQRIFFSATNAIDQIDSQIQDEINKLFEKEGEPLVTYPSTPILKIKRGDDPKGFAFSIENQGQEGDSTEFTYLVEATSVEGCGSLTEEQANRFIKSREGSMTINIGDRRNKLMLIEVPKTAPVCTIAYSLEVDRDDYPGYGRKDIYIKLK